MKTEFHRSEKRELPDEGRTLLFNYRWYSSFIAVKWLKQINENVYVSMCVHMLKSYAIVSHIFCRIVILGYENYGASLYCVVAE